MLLDKRKIHITSVIMRQRIEVVLEYTVLGPYKWGKPRKHTCKRIVKSPLGLWRVDQKGINAKEWKTTSWGGDFFTRYESAIFDCRSVKWWHRFIAGEESDFIISSSSSHQSRLASHREQLRLNGTAHC